MVDHYLVRRQRVAAPIALIQAFPTVSPFAWPIGVVLGGVLYRVLVRGQSILGTTPAQDAEASRVIDLTRERAPTAAG